MERRRCETCGAEILMLPHFITGNFAPIDAAPSPDGNVIVDLEAGRYRIATKKDAPGERHKNHYATCPQAGDWRTRKGGRS